MKTPYILLLNCLVLFASCNSTATDPQVKKLDSVHTIIESATVPSDTVQTTVAKAVYSKIIKIDYQKNKEILDILPLLPDSAMASWEWKKEERAGMVRSLATSNQFIDTTENYNTIMKLTPNYFETSVVDGEWIASLYKVSENHYIVITNDMVGDGNKINAFEVKGEEIAAINVDNLIEINPGNLMLKNDNEKCKSVIVEDEIEMLTYDFSNPGLISISSPYLTKKANSACFKGNEAIFKFNENLKRFDLIKIDWWNSKP